MLRKEEEKILKKAGVSHERETERENKSNGEIGETGSERKSEEESELHEIKVVSGGENVNHIQLNQIEYDVYSVFQEHLDLYTPLNSCFLLTIHKSNVILILNFAYGK
jgi:hypothetical protein